MKYRTLLVDDEVLALQRLERQLKPYDFIQIVDRATSGRDAVKKINMLKPDLIFLDIQMPELTGFEVIKKINSMPYIIFSTAYDEYALKAFETNSIDYLLKPVDSKRLQRALEKLKRLTQDELTGLKEQLQKAVNGLDRAGKKRIQVKIGNHIRLLNLSDIHFFRASEKYIEIHTFDEVFLLHQSLNQLETDLPQDDFVRIHRSAIINLTHLEEIIKVGPAYQVIMKNQKRSRLSVSRNSKSKLGLAKT